MIESNESKSCDGQTIRQSKSIAKLSCLLLSAIRYYSLLFVIIRNKIKEAKRASPQEYLPIDIFVLINFLVYLIRDPST